MVKSIIRNATAVAGAGAIFAGLWMIYFPAALIVVGVLAVAGSVWGHLNDDS